MKEREISFTALFALLREKVEQKSRKASRDLADLEEVWWYIRPLARMIITACRERDYEAVDLVRQLGDYLFSEAYQSVFTRYYQDPEIAGFYRILEAYRFYLETHQNAKAPQHEQPVSSLGPTRGAFALVGHRSSTISSLGSGENTFMGEEPFSGEPCLQGRNRSGAFSSEDEFEGLESPK